MSRASPLFLDFSAPIDDAASLFPPPVEAVNLEIGFGGGEHLVHEALANSRQAFIGVEPFEAGLAKAALAVERHGLSNVRLADRDAAELLDWLPPASLLRIDLLFADPWPKRRHHKRRFVNAQNLERIVRCLVPGGVFRFASDVENYVDWTLAEIAHHGELQWIAADKDACRAPWHGWPGTRYEAKALKAGRRPAYLTFVKPVADLASSAASRSAGEMAAMRPNPATR